MQGVPHITQRKSFELVHWTPTRSINCFEPMRFGLQFATSQHHMVLVSLVSLQQEKKETLRSFMERFGKVALDILNLDSMVVMHHLVTTLQPKLFINSLCKKPTSNLDKLRCRATKYIQLEEFIEYNRQLRNKPTAVKKKANKDVHKPKERPREAWDPRYNHYTPPQCLQS